MNEQYEHPIFRPDRAAVVSAVAPTDGPPTKETDQPFSAPMAGVSRTSEMPPAPNVLADLRAEIERTGDASRTTESRVTTLERQTKALEDRASRFALVLGELSSAHETALASALETSKPATFHYDFKPAPELIWAIITAAGTVLVTSLTDVEKVTDWRTWAIGVGAALVRAVFGALMSYSSHQGTARAEG